MSLAMVSTSYLVPRIPWSFKTSFHSTKYTINQILKFKTSNLNFKASKNFPFPLKSGKIGKFWENLQTSSHSCNFIFLLSPSQVQTYLYRQIRPPTKWRVPYPPRKKKKRTPTNSWCSTGPTPNTAPSSRGESRRNWKSLVHNEKLDCNSLLFN